MPATAAIAPTVCGDGPPWMPVSWSTAWPLPRAISLRFTGKAATPAMTSATDRAAPEEHVAEPGLDRSRDQEMIALSTTSMIAMLTVSVASAIGTTAANAKPARSSGQLVSV